MEFIEADVRLFLTSNPEIDGQAVLERLATVTKDIEGEMSPREAYIIFNDPNVTARFLHEKREGRLTPHLECI